MGIKTKFNPMGGGMSDKGDLSEWYYNTYPGQTPGIELKVYAGFGTDVYVPKRNTILQDYVNNTVNTIYQHSGSATYVPSDFSPLPDHVECDTRLTSSRYINVTNPSGTITYNESISPKGTSILLPKDWSSVEVVSAPRVNFVGTYYQSPFVNANTIVNLDLQGVKWLNNSMRSAFNGCTNLAYIKDLNTALSRAVNLEGTFYNCTNFNQNIQIPNSVTNLSHTFYGCYNLNQNIQIPNSVTNLSHTFYYCSNLNQNIQIPNLVTNMDSTFYLCNILNQLIQIPNSVTNMYYTFGSCFNLNQNIQIPNSVTNVQYAFSSCSNLNQNIQIPNSVTNLSHTFYGCYNLNQNIQIPNLVTNMQDAFYGCSNLNQNIQIPSSVTNMYYTFYRCSSFGSWINISSTNVTCAFSCFNVSSGSSIPNVFYVYKYLNDAITPTFNSINAAGWKANGQGAIVGTSPDRIRTWDDGANYSTRSYNGTHCILSKWVGALDTFLNNNVTWTTPIVPQRLFLSNYPVAVNRACFSKNTALTGIDLGTDIPWVGNQIGTGTNTSSRNAVCLNCFNITWAKGVIADGVTDASASFDRCYNIKESNLSIIWPDTITKHYVTYEMLNVTDLPPFGEGVLNMQSCCFSLNTLVNYPVIPPKVTSMVTMFANGCAASARGNIFILSPSVGSANAAVAGAFFRSYNTSNRRNVYIYYNYSNGTNTTTKTTFMKNAIYRGTSGNGTNPMYNSTSNFYIYNLSASYSEIWNSYTGTTSTTLLEYNKAQEFPHMAVFAQYPDYNVTMIGNNCFREAFDLRTLALYNRPFNSTNLSYAFDSCYHLTVIQGLNLDGVTNMSHIFEDCESLEVCRSIPDSVTNLAFAFNGCANFNFNVQIGNGVTNMHSTFLDCGNLNQNIQIPNSVTSMGHIFYNCYSFNQNIQIPNSVTELDYAFGWCSNLKQNIQIPASVINMNGTFLQCDSMTGTIRILSENVANAVQCFFSHNTSLSRNVLIPFKYANGVNTKTFNSFKAAGYLDANGVSTNQHGAVIYNIGAF